MKRKTTVALCAIVKNEERFLPKCLASVQGAVDELVIVDTGSTDRTVEIAQSFGATVYHHPWQDSFSEARNFALERVQSAWVLVLDADEELERRDISVLRQVVRTEQVTCFFLPVLNQMPDRTFSQLYSRRLFRRGMAHYEGIVHNQLVVQGPSAPAPIRIYHYGYDLSPEEMAAKQARSERLLLRQIVEQPDDPFPRFNLARIYRNQGRWQEAIEVAQEGLRLCGTGAKTSTYYMLLFDLAYCFMMVDRLSEAEALCVQGLTEYPKNLDLRFTLGTIYARQNRFQEAMTEYRRFLETLVRSKADPAYNFSTLIVDSWSFENRAWHNIGQCLVSMGRFAEAEELYAGLLQTQKDQLFFKGLAHCKLVQKDFRGASQVLEEAVAAGVQDAFLYFQLGEVWRELGDPAVSMDYFSRAVCLAPDNVDIMNGYGHALLCNGQYDQAIEVLEKARSQAPKHIGVQVGLLRALLAAGRRKEAGAVMECLKGAHIDAAETNRELGDACVRVGFYEDAIYFYERALKLGAPQVQLLSNIATCYARLGHEEAALLGYKAALELQPDYEVARRNLAILKREMANTVS
ncbi:MAG: tetratricopeptide repeat protein [candidate division KSB1 bacterium]|nr:tetratricopeptide repeat protein [candidate division KSB1 bacterium]